MISNNRIPAHPRTSRARWAMPDASPEDDRASWSVKQIADKAGRIVGRYPVIFVTTAVLASAALGWWVKRK